MSQPFTVIDPVLVNDANFVSSNIPEDDAPLYSAATTYNLGDRVILTTGYHAIYESLTNTNIGNFPPDNPLNWVEVAPTNAWAAFDESGGTLSNTASPLEFVVTGDGANGFGFLELTAASVRLRAETPLEGVYYDQTIVLEDRANVASWFDYFFADIDLQTEALFLDVPPILGSTYTATIEGAGDVSLGTFVMGKQSQFGFTEYGARASIIDYSRKEVDQFGRATFVQRGFAKRMDVTIWMDRGVTDNVGRLLSRFRAKPVLWIGAQDQFELLTIYGVYRDFSIDIAYPTQSLCTLEIEGLV